MRFRRINKTGVYMSALAASIFFLTACANRVILSVEPNPVVLKVGDPEITTMLATVKRGGVPQADVRVTWAIDHQDVARIIDEASISDANGKAPSRIFGKKDGNTTLTVRAEGESISTPVMVIPVAKDPGPFTLTLSPNPLVLKVRDLKVVRATVKRGGVRQAGIRVRFTTGNEIVARALANGIILTDKDGEAPVRVFGTGAGNTSLTARVGVDSASSTIRVIPVAKDPPDNGQ